MVGLFNFLLRVGQHNKKNVKLQQANGTSRAPRSELCLDRSLKDISFFTFGKVLSASLLFFREHLACPPHMPLPEAS